MAVHTSRTYADVNAVVGGYLRDLAFAQSSQQKMFGYKRSSSPSTSEKSTRFARTMASTWPATDRRSATSRPNCSVIRASRSRDNASSAERRCLAESSMGSGM